MEALIYYQSKYGKYFFALSIQDILIKTLHTVFSKEGHLCSLYLMTEKVRDIGMSLAFLYHFIDMILYFL